MRVSPGSAASKRTPMPGNLTAVRRVTDERAYLFELIQIIGAGPDLEAILRGVVRLVTEATACHACFIYFRQEDGLHLRAASDMYQHLEGKVLIPFGEGLTGWVAKTRRSAHLREGALEDPRVRRAYFPELDDEVYQSLVSVPIFSRAGEVIGVCTLHADAPHEFARADLDFLEHTASLVAGAVENARLYEEATARVSLLSDLSQLSQRIASAESQAAVLAVVADGLRELLGADRAEIHLVDVGGRLQLAVARPDRAAPSRSDSRLLGTKDLARGIRDGRQAASDPDLAALWGEIPTGISIVEPLEVAGERLGVVAVAISGAADQAGTALAAVAAHTAVALKQHQVIEHLREQNLLKDFFRLLSAPETEPEVVGGLAARLGCDLAAAHVVLHVLPWRESGTRARRSSGKKQTTPRVPWPDRASSLEGRLAARFPGLLVDILEGSIRAIVPVGDAGATGVLESLGQMDWGQGGAGGATGGGAASGAGSDVLSAGASGVCCGAGSFARGFQEAESAAEVGGLIRGGPGVTAFEDLGPYRYVLQSEDHHRDRLQQQLELLVAYDRKRGTQLLETLEAYLDHRSNVVATSRALYVHANTLRQRLDRIERESGIDLERENWLTLAIATKVVKLRKMRETAEGRRNDG